MILEKLQQAFPSEILSTHAYCGDWTAVVGKGKIHQVLFFLKNDLDLGFDLLVDLCGVDYHERSDTDEPDTGKARFELVYHLYSLTHHHRLRLRVKVPEGDMTLPTATNLWGAADWFEREAYDMFGFRFEGHPNLKRLLLFDGFEGHPLRKDYPITRRQKIPVPREVP